MQVLPAVVHGLQVLAVQMAFLGSPLALLQKLESLGLQLVGGRLVLVDLGVGVEGLMANWLSWVVLDGYIGWQAVRWLAGEPALRSEEVGASLRRLRASREVLVIDSRLLLKMDEGG